MKHLFLTLSAFFGLATLLVLTNCGEKGLEKTDQPRASAGITFPDYSPESAKIPRVKPVEYQSDDKKPGDRKEEDVLSSASATCIAKLKNKMIDRALLFIDSPDSHIDDVIVNEVNAVIGKLKIEDQIFQIVTKLNSDVVLDLSVVSRAQISRDITKVLFSSSISAADKGSKAQFIMVLKYDALDLENRLDLNLTQEFNVSSDCNVNLASTEVLKFNYSEKEKIIINKSVFYPDTKDQELSKEYNVKPGEFLFRLNDRITKTNINYMSNPNLRIFIGSDKPLCKLKINEIMDKQAIKNYFTHSEAIGTKYDISMIFDDGVEVTKLKINEALPVTYEATNEKSVMTEVDQALWTQMNLGESIEGSRNINLNISKLKLYADDALKLKINYTGDLDLEIIKPYWKINSIADKEIHVESQQKLEDDSLPLSAAVDPGAELYLKESYYVQTNLLAIKDWSKDLKKDFKGTRFEMALKISKLVYSILNYDDEMVNNNIVRGLKTEEIIARKNGVCQHFSNLYTALARAVGLPTRMITGYLFNETGNGAGPHAWVEIELKPGHWRPVEPQRQDMTLSWRRYLPLAVAAIAFQKKKPG